ncbi:DUF1007 family protein [Leucothrix pacifica]|nr:DUF1007 family protein [Leucothrix pacifica]
MLKKQFNKLLSTLVLGLLFITSIQANAGGFHYQLELTARLDATPNGQLDSIEMSWIFDPQLSITLMDGEDLSEANRAETLQRRASNVLSSFAEMGYFTKVLLNRSTLMTLEVEDYNLDYTDTSQLQLSLKLPLAKPVNLNLKGQRLQIVISDPTAAGLATFVTTDHLLLGELLATTCNKPSLAKEQAESDDGHILVSETMTIDC